MKLIPQTSSVLCRCALVLFAAAPLGAFAAYERAPAEVVRALGTTRGKLISTGLVFIDGKYVRAPYRVTRVGNQIQINDRLVTGQLVSWEELLKTQDASNLQETEVEVSDEPAAQPAAEREAVDPAAPKDGGDPAAPKGGEAQPSLDDLFSMGLVTIDETRWAAGEEDSPDAFARNAPQKMKLTDIPSDSAEDLARQKRGEEAAAAKAAAAKEAEEEDEEEETKDDGAKDEEKAEPQGDSPSAEVPANKGDEEELDPASPEGEAAAKAKAAATAAKPPPRPGVKTRKVNSLVGKFEMNYRAKKLMKPVMDRRLQMEKVLRRGGFLFIGTGPKRYLKGAMSDSVWTKELLRKLPELMSVAKGEEAFCDAVQASGLMSYINLQIARDLYRHKTDYFALKQRRSELGDGR